MFGHECMTKLLALVPAIPSNCLLTCYHNMSCWVTSDSIRSLWYAYPRSTGRCFKIGHAHCDIEWQSRVVRATVFSATAKYLLHTFSQLLYNSTARETVQMLLSLLDLIGAKRRKGRRLRRRLYQNKVSKIKKPATNNQWSHYLLYASGNNNFLSKIANMPQILVFPGHPKDCQLIVKLTLESACLLTTV